MSVITDYSPADVLGQMLINAAQVSDYDSNGQPVGDWPVAINEEKDSPDNVVTLYDIAGGENYRNNIDNRVFGPAGFQVRVRASTQREAWSKASSLYAYLSEGSGGGLYMVGVSIGSSYYLVHAVSHMENLITLQREPGSSRRIVVFSAQVTVQDQTP